MIAMSDASTYRSRVSQQKKPRNIPFEAEQLLYRFTFGSSNPPKGQTEYSFAAAHAWDNPAIPQPQTIENSNSSLNSPSSSAWHTVSPSFSTPPASSVAVPPPSGVNVNVDTSPPPLQNPLPGIPTRQPASCPTSQTITARVSSRPRVLSSNETPRQASRDHLRKSVTVSNARSTPRQATSSAQQTKKTTSYALTQRPRELDSSPEYQSSGDSSNSSPQALTPKESLRRRSSRARKDPRTYNVRTLIGLELETAEDTGSGTDPGSGNNSRRTSPKLPSTPLNTSTCTAPQIPQKTGSGSLCDSPNIERFLWDRQRGRFRSNAYNHAYTSKFSELAPWRRWKGASNDVLALAWSPDSTRFVAGATASTDDYNRGNNLLLGDLSRNTLRELPDHWIPRMNPISTQDPRLFTTVCSTQWIGERLYTASYDHTVKIWDVGQGASCVETLKHDSEVEMMAVSKYMPNRLATGSRQGFHLWNLSSQPSSENLDIVRSSGQKAVDLAPTNLMWGHTSDTQNLLIGGMVQRSEDGDFQVARFGHLGMWRLEESSVTTIKLSPDSQNIFDVKWHPSAPIFAAGTTLGDPKSHPPGSHSVVNLHTYKPWDSKVIHSHSFSCPAMDINEVTFCPIGSHHVTASCTDGSTYVWDTRFPAVELHKLQHGDPIHPINHEYRRELADIGVRAALWGTSIDQFYTGGSDGCLKQWDIRRATEDALVANVATFEDAVISAAFSPDKAHLLVGDNGGGINVLSSGPCSDPEPGLFDFEYAPIQEKSPRTREQEPPEPEGIAAARELLSRCELTMHPLYGPVQGPEYSGPFARWARKCGPEASAGQLSRTPLLEEYQLRQFEGPIVRDRRGLDDHSKQELQRGFNLAHARNNPTVSQPAIAQPAVSKPAGSQATSQKRKRQSAHLLISSDEETRAPSPKKPKRPTTNKARDQPNMSSTQSDIIDLTLDSDDDGGPIRPNGVKLQPTTPSIPTKNGSKMENPERNLESSGIADGEPFETLTERLEDDHWWPENGQVNANIPRGVDG